MPKMFEFFQECEYSTSAIFSLFPFVFSQAEKNPVSKSEYSFAASKNVSRSFYKSWETISHVVRFRTKANRYIFTWHTYRQKTLTNIKKYSYICCIYRYWKKSVISGWFPFARSTFFSCPTPELSQVFCRDPRIISFQFFNFIPLLDLSCLRIT